MRRKVPSFTPHHSLQNAYNVFIYANIAKQPQIKVIWCPGLD